MKTCSAYEPGQTRMVLPAGVPHRIQFPVAGVLVAAHLNYRVLGGIDVVRFYDLPHRLTGQAGKMIGNLLQHIARGRQTLQYGIPSAVREKALGFELLALILKHGTPRRIDVARIMQLQRLSRVLEVARVRESDGRQIDRDVQCESGVAPAANVHRRLFETLHEKREQILRSERGQEFARRHERVAVAQTSECLHR